MKVPADAEFVLEGYVDNEDVRVEGPFGDHTGVYSLADYYPTFHVTCVTHRRNPIFGATVVGKPPMEDAWLGKTTERIFLPLLQMVVPEIVDYNLPVEGGFHNLCIVSIKKSYPGQAKKVMNALWGLGHMLMLTRCLLVVDADVDVHDPRAVAWYALNNVDPSRDLVVMPGPVDDLDHSGSYLVSVGHKLGIDATRKGADEGYLREWPPDIAMDEATRDLVSRRWSEYGIRWFTAKPNAYSGQGEAALERLLAQAPYRPGFRRCNQGAAREWSSGSRRKRTGVSVQSAQRHPPRSFRSSCARSASNIRFSRFRSPTSAPCSPRAACPVFSSFVVDHARRARRADGGDGDEPLRGSRDRRQESANGTPRTSERDARTERDAGSGHSRHRAARDFGRGTQPALPQTAPARGARHLRVSVLQALHVGRSLRPRGRRRLRAARRVRRGRGSRLVAVRPALPRRHDLGRGFRRRLCVDGS